MTGGAGADDFDFNNVAEIGRGATRDVIRDFVHLVDDIDLSTIDANGGGGGQCRLQLPRRQGRSIQRRGGRTALVPENRPAPPTTRPSSKATSTATASPISRFS